MLKIFPILAALGFMLSGCGGGGDGVVTSNRDFPIAAVYIDQYTKPSSRRFSISGNLVSEDRSISGSGTVTSGALEDAIFGGTPAKRQLTVITINWFDGNETSQVSDNAFVYLDSNFNIIGQELSDEYLVLDGSFQVPITARVGDTGVIATYKRYTSSERTSLWGARTVTFAVEADTADTALLKVVSVDKDTTNLREYVSTSSLRLNADGSYKVLSESEFYHDYGDTVVITYE